MAIILLLLVVNLLVTITIMVLSRVLIGFIISAKSKPSPIHIFLSFRGTDTRDSFASLLYDALIRAGFNVFMDDESIRAGQEIQLDIKEAIERSKGAAIIFSKDFASSKWCLDELVLILDQNHKLGSKYILEPIYVDGVQPYEVRNQIGSFGKAFAKHKKWYSLWDSDHCKNKEYRDALKTVGGYRGRILKGNWMKSINEIVEDIRQGFRKLGITVTPPCCQYHSSVMDRIKYRVQDVHDFIRNFVE